MTNADRKPTSTRRRKLRKWLTLGGLAVLGLCIVSIPVIMAFALSGRETSDALTTRKASVPQQHATPAGAVARMRCVPRRGSYALTFDDGPIADTTPRLVAALRKARAVATFFDIGERVAAHQGIVELQRSVGEVASHSYSHPHMPGVSQARRLQELRATASVLDHPNTLFRPPYGETSPATDADVHRTGLTPVYWTVDTQGTRMSQAAITARALRVKPGGIILLRDGVEGTIGAVPRIVQGLSRRGMCPGFLAITAKRIVGANGVAFHAIAVAP